METQKCPHCGEENPAEAVMCWACYTPLGEGKTFAPRPAPMLAVETSMGEKIKRRISDAVPFAAMAGLAASGWLLRKTRLPVAGASLGALFGPMLLDELKSRLAKDKPDAEETNYEAQLAPAVRIAETVLYYALRDKATSTRFEENGCGVRVCYQIEGEWCEQMKIPRYVWKSLRQQLLRYARQGECDLRMLDYEVEYRKPLKLTKFRAQMETNGEGETLYLQVESAPFDEFENDLRLHLPPDIECVRCKEWNLPGAVWCWNCGADLTREISAQREKHAVLTALILAGLAVSASSGWWPRRARLPILSVGALSFAAPFALDKLDERQKRKYEEEDEKRGITHEWEAPATRMADTILLRAIREKTATIRLRECGNVVVSYQIGEAWQQDAILPNYVWLALRNDLLKKARGFVTCGGKKYRLNAELSSEASGETLDLQLDKAG